MSSYSYSRNAQLRKIKDSYMIDYNLTFHNKLPTFCRKGIKSCIDFFISNCHTKFLNIRTHYKDDENFKYEDINYNNIMSDHVMVLGVYNNKKL